MKINLKAHFLKVFLFSFLAVSSFDARADIGQDIEEARQFLDKSLSGQELLVIGEVGTLEGAINFVSEFRRSNVFLEFTSRAAWAGVNKDMYIFAWLRDTGEFLITVPSVPGYQTCFQIRNILNELIDQASAGTIAETNADSTSYCVDERDRYIGLFQVFDDRTEAYVGEDYFTLLGNGYKSEADFAFSRETGVNSSEGINALIDVGITTGVEFEALTDDVYSIKRRQLAWSDIWEFVELINQYGSYQAALEIAGNVAEREIKEQQREAEERARLFPYYALVTCQFRGSVMPLAACFAGDVPTEISLVTTGGRRTVKYFEFQSIGSFDNAQNTLRIDLTETYAISAQNASDTLAVHLEIKRTGDDSLVYSENQGRLFGVASHRQ